MQWTDLIGHARQLQWFRTAALKQRMGSTFLMVGPEGIGKRTFARLVAKSLLCHHADPKALEACGHCESCAQVDASTHPDLLQVGKPEEKSVLPIDMFAGDRENRGQSGLIRDIHMKAYHGRGKVAIIDDADYFNEESANCMLKTLEEPPLGARIFLIGTSLQRQLPTIRSRSQVVRFQELSSSDLAILAARQGLAELDSHELSSMREGSLTAWKERTDKELHDFRNQLIERLAARPMDFIGLSKAIVSSLDQVAKEGPKRRMRLKLILLMVVDFYRQSWMVATGNGVENISPLVKESVTAWRGSGRPAALAMERSLNAIYEVDRNLSPANILESWAADIATICGG